MKKSLIILSLTMILGGCISTSPVLLAPQYNIPKIDEALYNCPEIKKFPNYVTLTESEVAVIIVTLYKNNKICKQSLESIRKILTQK